MLREWGGFLGRLAIPSMATQACAQSAKMSDEIDRVTHGKLPPLQNEITTSAMLVAIDFACAPPRDLGEVSEGSPDPSDLM